jgi:uroporphyrin-III C-methyltransferase/precorrin-2 dehydrogenase/sirohydrochlorin ferrochelatase
MNLFPLFANLRGQPCLIVGGGEVAARKARDLLAAGAKLTVNAPEFSVAVQSLADGTPDVRLAQGPFDPALVGEHLLVVAATSDRFVNAAVASAAGAAQRLCNVVDDGAASTFIVPGIVDRSPLVVAISSGGCSPVLSRLLRQKLERELPSRLGHLAHWAGRWRETVRKRLTEPGLRRRFWERLLGGAAASRVLRDDEAGADELARAMLDGAITGAPGGRAWLVGAGPGDADLISLRGLQVLQQADVVMHDRLVAPELLRSARREAEIICVGKTGGAPSVGQDEINRLLVSHVRAGRRVCRLKGGDPFVFGRGGEEALALKAAGLPFEIVPGITAASGCGAYAGIPLTHRGLSAAVTLATAQGAAGEPGPDWAALAGAGHTLVVYMGGRTIGAVTAKLMRHGRAPATPAAVISHGTTSRQEVVTGTLADIAGRSQACGSLSPALLVIGETAALAADLAWTREPGAGISGEDEPGPAFFPAAVARVG